MVYKEAKHIQLSLRLGVAVLRKVKNWDALKSAAIRIDGSSRGVHPGRMHQALLAYESLKWATHPLREGGIALDCLEKLLPCEAPCMCLL